MSTFNAGSIEANLTLDRSAWARDLKKTFEEIHDLEGKSIEISISLASEAFRAELENVEVTLERLDGNEYSPSIDLDVDKLNEALIELEARIESIDERNVMIRADADVDNAIVQLGLVETEMDLLENDPVMIQADADVDNAMIQLSLLEDQMDLLETDGVNIQADADTAAATAQLEALSVQAGLLDGKTVNVDVDYDQDTFEQLVGGASSGGGGHMGLLRILIYAIIALSPILGVAIGAMSAAIVGFTAALVGALGPLAVLGVGIFGLIQRFKDAKESGEELSGPMQALDDALSSLSDAWEGFLDKIEDEGFNLMADAVELLASVLPTLAPLFNEVAEMMGGVLDGIREWINSPEYDEMLDFFMGFGIDMLETFLRIGGKLLQFFGRLFQAIEPFAREMMAGLEDAVGGWAEWADDLENNEAFQQWVDRALEYGPMLFDMLGSLGAAFANISEALEPFAGPMLEALTWFFDLIANADPDVLTIIIAALAGLWAGINIIVPLVGALTTGITLLGGAIAFILSPIGLIILAVIALVAIFIYLWNTNEEFRTAVINTWNAIYEAIAPIVQDIVNLIRENWGPISEWVRQIWSDVQSIITDAMVIIQQIVRGATAVIRFIWRNFGDNIIAYIRAAFQIVGGVIRGWFTFAKGIFQTIKAVLTGDWRGMWEGIKTILRGAGQILTSILRGTLNGLKALWSAAWTIIKGVFGRIWDDIKQSFGDSVEWIKDKIGDMIGFFRSMPGKISNAVSGAFTSITTQFRNVINGIIGWWNNLSFSFDIPDKIPGLPDSFHMDTPNVSPLAKGAFVTDPLLAVVGEGQDNEIVAPEPVLERIVRENGGANIDYGRLASAIAAALAPIFATLGSGITKEDLERIIASAAPKIDIDARSDHEAAGRLASAIGFELRLLGYGGKSNV